MSELQDSLKVLCLVQASHATSEVAGAQKGEIKRSEIKTEASTNSDPQSSPMHAFLASENSTAEEAVWESEP